MHMSMGKDRMKLMRDALPAILRAAAFSSSVAGTSPRIFFWFGQMKTHTLNNMMVTAYVDGELPIDSIDHLVSLS